MKDYSDIIALPRPVSKKHPQMGRLERAAQFAPFAALSGYDEMVTEEARITEQQAEPSGEELERLNRRFTRLSALLAEGARPRVTVLLFVPDEKKAGGRYETVSGEVRRLDPVMKKLILLGEGSPAERISIDMDRILDLSSVPEDED